MAATLGLALLVAQSFRPTSAVNRGATATAAYQATDVSVKATGTAYTQSIYATATVTTNIPYNVQVPGPCDTLSGADWIVSGIYQCLPDGIAFSVSQQVSEHTSLLFGGRAPAGFNLPLNYRFSMEVGHFINSVCVSLYPSIQRANMVGGFEVELCSNLIRCASIQT